MNNEKDELVGKVIDGYKVLELKGQGRYCKVYKAKDEDFEQAFVAIKTVNPEEVPILEQEAKLLDRLQCDNIPKVYKYEDGKLFMEYFDNSLRNILDQKKVLDWKDATNAAIDVLKALEHAHSKKQIHRDIKPSNILTDGKKYVLNDFNLANNLVDQAQKDKDKRIELSGGMDVSVGKAKLSCVGGTEGYKAPEQIIGTSKDADERTDIYGLSAVLYEMLTGKLPLGRFESPQNAPLWLTNAVKKGLAQDKEIRFKTAKDMRQKLEDGLEGKIDDDQIEAAIDWTWDKIKKAGKFAILSPWYIAKYTVFAPITLTCFFARKSDETYRPDSDNYMSAAVITGLLSLGLYIGLAIGTPLQIMHQNRINELQNSDRRGKIAYVLQGQEIRYYDASRMLEENKEEIRLCPKDISSISDLVWSVDGKKLYFTGTYSGAPIIQGETASIPATRQIFSIDLEGKQEVIAPLETEYQLHKTAKADGKEVIYLKKGKEYYVFDTSTKKTERVAKVTAELEETQKVSPDKKYALDGSMYDDIRGIVIKKGDKKVKTVLEEGFDPAWWHGDEQK